MVECKICGKELRQIHWGHLRTHGISFEEYRERYGGRTMDDDLREMWKKMTPWKGRERKEETKEKISRSVSQHLKKAYKKEERKPTRLTGEDNPMKREEVAEKVSQSLEERFENKEKHPSYGEELSEETKQKISVENKKHSEKMSRLLKEKRTDPKFQKKMFKGTHSKPNNLEKKFMKIVDNLNLPLNYVGEGSKIIDGKNPDFISEDGELVVEIFGRRFHDPENEKFVPNKEDFPYHQTEKGAKEFYQKRGKKCLIFWDDELETDHVKKEFKKKKYLKER